MQKKNNVCSLEFEEKNYGNSEMIHSAATTPSIPPCRVIGQDGKSRTEKKGGGQRGTCNGCLFINKIKWLKAFEREGEEREGRSCPRVEIGTFFRIKRGEGEEKCYRLQKRRLPKGHQEKFFHK